MKMTTMYGYRRLTCEVSASVSTKIDGNDPSVYGEDAVCYAACRFLRKNHDLCRKYVTESYLMRFAKTRREKTPRRHRFLVPAKCLELPGHLVWVQVMVTPSGVTVERISLYNKEYHGKLHAEDVLDGEEHRQ